MPQFTILLMPFVLVGVLEMRGWSHHLRREPAVSKSSAEKDVAALSAISCRLPPQPEAAEEIAPRHESLEQPQ